MKLSFGSIVLLCMVTSMMSCSQDTVPIPEGRGDPETVVAENPIIVRGESTEEITARGNKPSTSTVSVASSEGSSETSTTVAVTQRLTTTTTTLRVINPASSRTDTDLYIHDAASPSSLPERHFMVENTPCTGRLERYIEAPEAELVAAVEATLEDVYVEKALSRLDGIRWTTGDYYEWAPIYEAVGEAADTLEHQPLPKIDTSRRFMWSGIDRGQYIHDGECVASVDVPLLTGLILFVPVTEATPIGDIVLQRQDYFQEIFKGGYQKFVWDNDRWKLDWRYWCMTVGAVQGEGGVDLFENIAALEYSVPFQCDA